MQILKISKSFHWEMGHRLPFHNGKCKNLHGHSYHFEFSLEGYVDENGMLLDFYDVKQVVAPIIEELDHSFMVSSKDPELVKLLEGIETKLVNVDFQSTAENINLYILNRVAQSGLLPKNITKIGGKIYETMNSYASAEIDLKN